MQNWANLGRIVLGRHKRLDISCAVALLSQETEEDFERNRGLDIITGSKVVLNLGDKIDVLLHYPGLDKASLSIEVYSDAYFASNHDISPRLCYIIFLSDKHQNCQPFFWTLHNSRRVNRSVLGSTMMPFADVLGKDFPNKYELQAMTNHKVPVPMMTDNLSLFDNLTKSSMTFEERLMIYLRTDKCA